MDTGYSGFLLVPEDVFASLGLEEDHASGGVLANRKRVKFGGAFATLEFPGQGVTADGFVQTASWASEVLLGIDGMRRLFVGIDSCAKSVVIEPC